MHYKRKRFFNKMYLERIADFLSIDYYKFLPIDWYIEELQEAKSSYLAAKSYEYSLRDQYVDSAIVDLKQKWNIEKLKAY